MLYCNIIRILSELATGRILYYPTTTTTKHLVLDQSIHTEKFHILFFNRYIKSYTFIVMTSMQKDHNNINANSKLFTIKMKQIPFFTRADFSLHMK